MVGTRMPPSRSDITMPTMFWLMLYESAARAEEILNLDIEDLDTVNRCATVVHKAGDPRRDQLADQHRAAAAAVDRGPERRARCC